jgi:O-acetyl-ADP-ribose deacetylase (regulator of RNase III)/catechol 2,3-dioxygenase-like lactoylglutathione lyase family enzyme
LPIEIVAGDLFANAYRVGAFAHGCNCQGSMGAGIAKGFKARYPEMFERFRAMCKAAPRQFNLGDAWLWKEDDKPWVFNLGTQEAIWRARASYEAIEAALTAMRRQADEEAVSSIGMPRIGVGYGGLSWKKVRAIISQVFDDWPGQLIVYEEFVPSTEQGEETRHIPAAERRASKKGTGKPVRVKFMLRAITIYCTSVERSARFYGEVLGAVRRPTDNGVGDWFRLGKIELSLVQNAAEKSPADFPMHAMPVLWLEVDDLAAAARRFAEFEVDIVDEGDGEWMMIADPDRILIEVWQRETV